MGKVLRFETREQKKARREALIVDHMSIVPPIARYIGKGLPPSFELDDLVQAGHLGLIDAADKFDESQGVPFSAYARRRVYGEMMDSVRRRKYVDATHDSIDDHTYDLKDTSLMDAEQLVERRQKVERIDRALEALTAREKVVIQMHYRQDQNLIAVGEVIECHPSRASQLHTAALGKLRVELKAA
jgi:RNA polymerase sigma factor (sigma-70 family)